MEDGKFIGSVRQGNTPKEAYDNWLAFCYERAYKQSSIINKQLTEKYERLKNETTHCKTSR